MEEGYLAQLSKSLSSRQNRASYPSTMLRTVPLPVASDGEDHGGYPFGPGTMSIS